MDIMQLTNVTNPEIARKAAKDLGHIAHGSSFDTLFNSVLSQIQDTNQLAMDAETARMEFIMGESVNSHDHLIAQQKAATALQFTVTIKNSILEAYNQIMQMQI